MPFGMLRSDAARGRAFRGIGTVVARFFLGFEQCSAAAPRRRARENRGRGKANGYPCGLETRDVIDRTRQQPDGREYLNMSI